jgi:hypothetical protein
MFSDSGSIKYDGSSSDEAFVADLASVNNRAVSHSYTITNETGILGRAVNNNIIL